MVESVFVTWEQIQPLFYIALFLTAFLVFIKWRYTYVKDAAKVEATRQRKSKSIDAVIDQKLEAIPAQLKAVEEEIKHLELTNASEKQMKSLKDKKRMLELGRDYGDIAAEIGKPVIRTLLSAVKGLSLG